MPMESVCIYSPSQILSHYNKRKSQKKTKKKTCVSNPTNFTTLLNALTTMYGMTVDGKWFCRLAAFAHTQTHAVQISLVRICFFVVAWEITFFPLVRLDNAVQLSFGCSSVFAFLCLAVWQPLIDCTAIAIYLPIETTRTATAVSAYSMTNRTILQTVTKISCLKFSWTK